MSQIQQLLTAVNNLTERLSQIESNSKRIYELPQNIATNGLSKFAISRPIGIGETTEYMTLNAILEWVLEEVQNIENSTILVQMLPPELLSSPRRIKIPTLSDETEVPIVWKILGVQYSESEEQEIEIPDADEDNYRKDLILGTQNGDVIRHPGIESEEGVIEPVQPENTVLLTSMVVFGDSVFQEPTEPIIGSNYIPKQSERWTLSTNITSADIATPIIINGNLRNWKFQANIGTGTFTIRRLDVGGGTGFYPFAPIWDGMKVSFTNVGINDITIKHFDTSLPSDPQTYKILLPNSEDVILKTGETINLYYDLAHSVFRLSSFGKLFSGGGDFIPLSGTEVGKPLTGNIEVDTTNDRVGFYSEVNDRFLGITDDGYNTIMSLDSSFFSYLEQLPGENVLYTQNNNSQFSRFETNPTSILLNNTDNEGGMGNSGELSINNYEFRFDSKTDFGNEFDGSLYYNAEEGLFVQNNHSGGYGQLDEYGLNGALNNKTYSLIKNSADSEYSLLLFPDSGSTQRRIPVSVNGVYANQQGDIELPADQVSYDNTASGLLAETVQEAVDELEDKKLDKITTGDEERVYSVNDLNQQAMIPILQEFIDISETVIVTAITTASYTNGIAVLTPMTVNKGRKYVDTSNGTLYMVFENDTVLRIVQ